MNKYRKSIAVSSVALLVLGALFWCPYVRKRRTRKQQEVARLASPHPEDRFTDREEEEMYSAGYKALKKKYGQNNRTK